MMELIFSILIVCILGMLIFLSADYASHIMQNKTHGFPYGWGTYRQFLKLYNQCNFTAKSIYRWSLFDYGNDCYHKGYNKGYLHAGIFEFNGKCFIFINPISYFRAMFLIHKEAIRLLKQTGDISKGYIDWDKELEDK